MLSLSQLPLATALASTSVSCPTVCLKLDILRYRELLHAFFYHVRFFVFEGLCLELRGLLVDRGEELTLA